MHSARAFVIFRRHGDFTGLRRISIMSARIGGRPGLTGKEGHLESGKFVGGGDGFFGLHGDGGSGNVVVFEVLGVM